MARTLVRTLTEKQTEAARRYFAAWPGEGAFVEATHARDREQLLTQFTVDELAALRAGRLDPKADPFAGQTDERKTAIARALYWLDIEDGHFGGVLGRALFGDPCPIATDDEIDELLAATAAQLRARPPVFIAQADGAWVPIAITPTAYARLDDWPPSDDFRAVVDAIAKAPEPQKTLADALKPWPMRTPDIRARYHAFARDVWSWHVVATATLGTGVAKPIDKDTFRTTPGLLAQSRPKQTVHAFHRVEQAIADHKNAAPNRDGDALVHRITNQNGHVDPVDVIFSPIDSRFFAADTPRFFPPPTLPDLMKKLDRIGSSGAFTFAVVISLAVAENRPQINIDDLIDELGLDPRSRAERAEYRALVWECLQVFAQTMVVGEIVGSYKDKKTGAPLKFIELSPVIAITGTVYPSEMRLDRSEPPVAVEYTLGKFFHRHRDNRQFLAYIGDLRQLAAIPGGKAAGQWARTLGIALFQHWREYAHDAEMKTVGEDSHAIARFKKIPTRRSLFERVKPDPNPFDILFKSTNPKRARTTWDAAIQMLVEQKIAVLVKTGKGEAKATESRKDWQDGWLDEPVDLRPHFDGNAITVDAVRDIAAAHKARRRRRPVKGQKKTS